MGYGYPGYWGGGSMGIFGFLLMLIWWALVIAAVVLFARWLWRVSNQGGMGKSALDVLKERYAKGEIDKKEFEERKKTLME